METKPVYHVEVRDVPEQVVASIRGRVAVGELDPWIARAIEELFARLAEQGIRPAGAPFAMMPAPNGRTEVDVVVALPAARKVSDRGRVEDLVVPACRALVTLHRGSYEELNAAYRALAVAMEGQGIEPTGDPREIYLSNPEDNPPEECETEVVWPIDVPADWTPVSPQVDRPLPRS